MHTVTDIIVKAVHPEFIFLLGSSWEQQRSVSIFASMPATHQQVTHYDLLVIVPVEERRSVDEICDIIENRCRVHAVVTAIVFPVDRFLHLLEAGHPFCCEVVRVAKQWHDAGNIPLPEPPVCNASELLLQAQHAFARWIGMADEFLAGAGFYCSRKQFAMAAFMLHQVVERCYVGLMLVMTGYRPGTHNLDKLSRYVRVFSASLSMIFPRNSTKEENLFQLLQKAYIHTRYKDDYVITGHDAGTLLSRAEQLLEVVKGLCKEKINALMSRHVVPELVLIGRAV